MRVLVTGASGMLGSTIAARWSGDHEVFATGRGQFVPPASWNYRRFDLAELDHSPLVEWAKPDVIVHCAAWTAVDACEADPQRADDINGRAVSRLIEAAHGARMIYISSDAVLGERTAPLDETAKPEPVNVYGRSKLLGEELARGHDCAIVRTTVVGWNLDGAKTSFVEWFVRTLQARERVTLFDDVMFSPIAAPHLADELLVLARSSERGLWHVSGRESLSRYSFGAQLCGALGLDPGFIRRGSIADVKFAAHRNTDQRLDVSAYERMFERELPTIDETIHALVRDRARVTEG